MIFSSSPSKKLPPEQQRIVRAHWEWAGGYAMFWIIVTVLIFGGVFIMLDFFGADDSVRTQSLVLLGTVTVVNAIWRAVGALAARIELSIAGTATSATHCGSLTSMESHHLPAWLRDAGKASAEAPTNSGITARMLYVMSMSSENRRIAP